MDLNEFAQKLVKAGYNMAFGITGSGSSYKLIKALTELGVKFTTVSTESAAAIAAGTYSYLYNKKALCIAIKGPGFINLLAGITACKLERFDVLCIAEEYDESAPLMQMHKRINQQNLVKDVTIAQLSLTDDKLAEVELENHPYNPGPKYFSLSKQLPQLSSSNKSLALSDELEYAEKLKRIQTAKKPLLIIGSLINRLQLNSIIGGFSLPILTSVQAKGTIDEYKANSAGVYTGVGNELVPEDELINSSDCVITLGLKNEEILGSASKSSFVNFDISNKLQPDSNTCYINIDQLDNILNTLSKTENWAINIIEKYKNLLNHHIEKSNWNTGKLFSKINTIKGNFTLVLDTGFFCTIGEHVFLSNTIRTFMGSSNGRNMGLSVPMALGSAINNQKTICCFGDGGIRYHMGDIRTIIELKLPVCFILISDGNYGSVAAYVGDDNWNPAITKPCGINWSEIIGAMKIQATVVDDPLAFEETINNWNQTDPIFIQANFEPNAYKGFTKKIRK